MARFLGLLFVDGDVAAATGRLVGEFATDPADFIADVDRTLAVLVSDRVVAQFPARPIER